MVFRLDKQGGASSSCSFFYCTNTCQSPAVGKGKNGFNLVKFTPDFFFNSSIPIYESLGVL